MYVEAVETVESTFGLVESQNFDSLLHFYSFYMFYKNTASSSKPAVVASLPGSGLRRACPVLVDPVVEDDDPRGASTHVLVREQAQRHVECRMAEAEQMAAKGLLEIWSEHVLADLQLRMVRVDPQHEPEQIRQAREVQSRADVVVQVRHSGGASHLPAHPEFVHLEQLAVQNATTGVGLRSVAAHRVTPLLHQLAHRLEEVREHVRRRGDRSDGSAVEPVIPRSIHEFVEQRLHALAVDVAVGASNRVSEHAGVAGSEVIAERLGVTRLEQESEDAAAVLAADVGERVQQANGFLHRVAAVPRDGPVVEERHPDQMPGGEVRCEGNGRNGRIGGFGAHRIVLHWLKAPSPWRGHRALPK